MEHAGLAALDSLEELLAAIRKREGVRERGRGNFFRKGRALVHFHQDAAGLFADLHDGPEWRRLRVSQPHEQKRFLGALDKAIKRAG